MDNLETKPENQEVIEPQENTNPDLDKARAGGWKPLEEWEGNPEDWADYKEFNKRGEYIEHIKSLSSDYKRAQKKIAKLEESFNQLAQHHSKVREIEYEKAMADLKATKKEAMTNMDYDLVLEVDEKISELKETDPKKQTQPATQQEVSDEVSAWVEENEWYGKDSILRGAVNAIVDDIVKAEPYRKNDIRGVLAEATMTLKKEFPNKFPGSSRTRGSSVIDPDGEPTNSQRGNQAPKNLARHLNEEQRKIAHRFVKQGALKTIEDYAQQLHEIGELKVRGA